MIEPDRTECQVRCAFNAFCKRVLRNETINIYKERRQQQAKELTFSDLGQSFQVAGKNITPKLLAEAMRTLPKEKRIIVLLYYFFNKSDVEIGQLLNIPRSTAQYRRTSSFKKLKRID